MRKEKLAGEIAKRFAASPNCERLLLSLCSYPSFAKATKLGAIAWSFPRIVPKSTIRTAHFEGYRFLTDISEYNGVAHYFFKQPGVYSLLQRDLLKPGMVCFDIGANMGCYSFWMAANVGPTGRVHAFEPQPEKVSLLQRSVALNHFEDRIVLNPLCLFSESGSEQNLFLASYPQNSGLASLIPDLDTSHRGKTSISVRTLRFDDYCAGQAISHIDLIKIDVEGAEAHVLAGMGKFLSEAKADLLLVELASGNEAQRLLESFGYRGWLLSDGPGKPVPIGTIAPGRIADYLFVSPSSTYVIHP